MTQAEAYFVQAKSDLDVFEALAAMDRTTIPECHPLHYLQMAAEKIAKAICLAWGIPLRADGYSHVAFSSLPQHMKTKWRHVARALNKRDRDDLRSFLDRAQWHMREIEELCPAVGPRGSGCAAPKGANAEYPWEGASGDGATAWHAPATWRFRLLVGSDGKRTYGLVQAHHVTKLLVSRFDKLAKLP
jgi:hypothetical protein